MPQRRPRLAVGVLLDGRRQEAWVADALRRALAVPGVALRSVALLQGLPPRQDAALFRWLDRLDCLGGGAQRAWARTDAIAALAAPRVAVAAARDGERWTLGPEAAERLRGCGVDLWLCAVAVAPRRPLPHLARLGAWSLVIGRDAPATDPWAGAAEIAAGSRVTAIGVTDWMRPAGGDLYRSFGSTVQSSLRRNRRPALAKGAALFARLVAGVLREGDAAAAPATSVAPMPADYPPPGRPTRAAARRLWSRALAAVARARWDRLRARTRWEIAYRFHDGAGDGWRGLRPPRGRLWADPFLLRQDGRRFVLFEEQARARDPGRIMAVEIFRGAGPGPAQLALARPYHLSYPFVFRWNGGLWMLPETGANRTVELYRCERFPDRWRLARVLLTGVDAYDATLCRHGGRWWMFVSIAEAGADPNDELHLYWSRQPLGPWRGHRANPVVSDVRRARGAGPLIADAGRLYRPSQDCSGRYGRAVTISRVDRLDEDAYAETPVRRIDADGHAAIRGIHTVGDDGEAGVLDLLVRRPRW